MENRAYEDESNVENTFPEIYLNYASIGEIRVLLLKLNSFFVFKYFFQLYRK